MATLDDVNRLACELPEVVESTSYGNRSWKVKGKSFAWERPLGKKDRADLGDAAPAGTIVGVRVADGDEKQLLLDSAPACFTIPHFDGYPAVLIMLDDVDIDELAEFVTDAWLCMAPPKLADAFVAEHGLDE